MTRLPDNLSRFSWLSARSECHIIWRDIFNSVHWGSWLCHTLFFLTIAKISDRSATLSGRDRASTSRAVSRGLHPQRRQNIWQESVANAVKLPHILAADVLRPS